jgi:hypothetical protein
MPLFQKRSYFGSNTFSQSGFDTEDTALHQTAVPLTWATQEPEMAAHADGDF